MDASEWITLIVAVGTLAVAAATFALAELTRREGASIREQAGLARDALEVSTRPLLADASQEEIAGGSIQFGAPFRQIFNLKPGHGFFLKVDDDDVLFCSVPFRNIGAGVAVVTTADALPSPQIGDVVVSRKFVRPGEVVRVNVTLQAVSSSEEPLAQAHRDGQFVVSSDIQTRMVGNG
jgi:hypothetical protein